MKAGRLVVHIGFYCNRKVIGISGETVKIQTHNKFNRRTYI